MPAVALGLLARAAVASGLIGVLVALDVIAVADRTRAGLVAAGLLVVLAIDALVRVRADRDHLARARAIDESRRAFEASHRRRDRAG